MTLDEAITDLKVMKAKKERRNLPLQSQAIGLGIEALKRIKHDREVMQAKHILLLPGETEG